MPSDRGRYDDVLFFLVSSILHISLKVLIQTVIIGLNSLIQDNRSGQPPFINKQPGCLICFNVLHWIPFHPFREVILYHHYISIFSRGGWLYFQKIYCSFLNRLALNWYADERCFVLRPTTFLERRSSQLSYQFFTYTK